MFPFLRNVIFYLEYVIFVIFGCFYFYLLLILCARIVNKI